MNIQNIPEELKKLKQWVCWAGDKLPKNPYSGGNAQSNNPETWSDFETAVRISADLAGIGFVFDGSGYFGVDLDDMPNDIEDYKQKIQKQKQLKNKTIKACKEFLNIEDLEILECTLEETEKENLPPPIVPQIEIKKEKPKKYNPAVKPLFNFIHVFL